MSKIDLQIYEKNPEAGGTWFENRYPGYDPCPTTPAKSELQRDEKNRSPLTELRCACDVPSHSYQYSWAPNPSWSKSYAPAAEICTYLDAVIDQHDLRKFMRFNHRCVSAIWSEDSSQWTTTFRHEVSHEKTVVQSDVLIYAVGRLNNYQIPLFKGRDKFKGQVLHTAAWPDDVTAHEKSVAVLGNGASGIQCVAGLRSGIFIFLL
jgi:cation diffusion facilitator CzcD-associated flavoprotein CzcO